MNQKTNTFLWNKEAWKKWTFAGKPIAPLLKRCFVNRHWLVEKVVSIMERVPWRLGGDGATIQPSKKRSEIKTLDSENPSQQKCILKMFVWGPRPSPWLRNPPTQHIFGANKVFKVFLWSFKTLKTTMGKKNHDKNAFWKCSFGAPGRPPDCGIHLHSEFLGPIRFFKCFYGHLRPWRQLWAKKIMTKMHF